MFLKFLFSLFFTNSAVHRPDEICTNKKKDLQKGVSLNLFGNMWLLFPCDTFHYSWVDWLTTNCGVQMAMTMIVSACWQTRWQVLRMRAAKLVTHLLPICKVFSITELSQLQFGSTTVCSSGVNFLIKQFCFYRHINAIHNILGWSPCVPPPRKWLRQPNIKCIMVI